MRAVLVTGALGGIGSAICREFAAAGYRVIPTDRADGAPASGNLLKVDVRDLVVSEERRRVFHAQVLRELGTDELFALVNNAAVQILGATDEIEVQHWRETLETNLLAPFILTQMFLPSLSAAAGSVINVASIHATMTKPRFVCYATSKAALVGLTKSMAVDLGPTLRVNAILPAAVSTTMLLEGLSNDQTKLAELGEVHPLQRIAAPREVAQAVLFLASDAASFMTGACLQLDGGVSARLHDPA